MTADAQRRPRGSAATVPPPGSEDTSKNTPGTAAAADGYSARRLDVLMATRRTPERKPGTQPEAEAFDYLVRLFGRTPGVVCVGVAGGPHVDESGSYAHRTFGQKWWPWPAKCNELAKYLANESRCVRDLYVNPVLRPVPKDRKTPQRRKSEPILAARHGWVDCDGEWTDEREATYSRLRSGGAWHVASGRGRHAYVPLSRPVPAEELERVNRTLVAALDGDAKWDRTSLLRPPGTLNWKPWAFGGADPAEVTLWT